MSEAIQQSRERDAQALFESWLARREDGSAESFEALRAGAPALAAELESLHAAWRRAERLFAGLDRVEEALDELRRAAPDASRVAALLSGLQADAGRLARVELLARTRCAEVWRARDANLGREVALKTVRDEALGDPRLVARFLREARLLARLPHPSIVGVHDLGVDERGAPWFTMPLVEGRTLEACAQDLSAGREPLPRAVAILADVAEAVAFAHERGVVHRDLKPGNILVGDRGQVVVLDWGLAGDQGDLSIRFDNGASAPEDTQQGALLGTPAYMSPEQARGETPAIGPRSDVYALGAILHRLLAGAPPHFGPDARAVADAVRAGPPPSLRSLAPHAPEELVSIAERAMRRKAEERYAGALEFARDLRAWLEGRVVSAHERGFVAHAAKWVRRNRLLASAGATLVVLGVGGALGFAAWRAKAAGEVLSLSDTVLAQELRGEADELFWPPRAERRTAIERWIERCEGLLARAGDHRRARAALEGAGAADQDARFRAALLARLVADLDTLSDTHGSRSLAAARGALARLDELDASSSARASAWRAALERIAANPRYARPLAEPRDELLPLGADPSSGLEEFALLGSGSIPVRGLDGRLSGADDAAMVMVLLPGGRSHVGALYGSRAGADPDATLDERPRGIVELEPYWIAKHELTQAQARSLWAIAPAQHVGSGRLPCESVSWTELATLLPRAGLDFPDEAQWEQAARATTQARWWTGDEPSSLVGAANLRGLGVEEPLPVGSLRANAFGLHDTAGNVAEWIGPGREAVSGSRLRATRGGHYASPPAAARSSAVEKVDAGHVDRRVGVRPVLAPLVARSAR
jgi:hypothetical protein